MDAGLTATADLARALGVSQRTVQRWVRHLNTPTRDKETRLLELAAVLRQANSALPEGPADTALWLRTPADQLDWQIPLDLISQGRFRQVIAALPSSQPAASDEADPQPEVTQ
jgi:putative toxin-antitoxin system antitoxin component (TIGR02293 family)